LCELVEILSRPEQDLLSGIQQGSNGPILYLRHNDAVWFNADGKESYGHGHNHNYNSKDSQL
jgi:hypothetical protein